MHLDGQCEGNHFCDGGLCVIDSSVADELVPLYQNCRPALVVYVVCNGIFD
jgi:hypothetical protein